MERLIASGGCRAGEKKRSRSGALLGRPSCSVRLPGAHSPWPTSPGRPRPAAGLRLRQPLKRLGEVVPQDAIGAPLGHPGPSLSYPGQPRHVEDGRAPPQSARLAHLVGRRHRAALRCLGLPARAQAEAAGGGGGEGRRVLRGEGRYNDGIERSAARLASRRLPRRRKDAVLTLSAARAAPRTGAAPRLLPVAARASTGASVADATFLVGISSRRSIGASSAPLAPLPPSPRWCSCVAL